MHHSTKRRVVLGMTTGGLLLTGMGMAQADASADGAAAHSPGLLSGNLIQAPIDAPINVCGNVIDVVGVLDSAAGNHCGNAGGNASTALGVAKGSPGVASGNLIQAPIDAPINVCGNSVSGVGVGNIAFDNTCSNGDEMRPPSPPVPPGHSGPPTCTCQPPATPTTPGGHGKGSTTSRTPGSLAETGTDVGNVVAPFGASMLGGGGLLLRKRVTSLRRLGGRQH